jgi:hypothetical protein
MELKQDKNSKFLDAILSKFPSDQHKQIKELILPKVLEEEIPRFSNLVKKDILRDMDPKLSQNNEVRIDFEHHIYEIWKKPFDLLDVFISMSIEAGDEYNGKYRQLAADTHDYKFDALTSIHSRACLISLSNMALLRGGFSDMAHANWRSIHELAIFAKIIHDNDNSTAEKYLLHDYVNIWNAMEEHHIAVNIHHLVPFKGSKDELNNAKEIVDKLGKQYGKEFLKGNGWAWEIVKHLPKEENRLSMKSLEKIAGLDYLRPYYKMASYNIHPDIRGTRFKLGLGQGNVAKNKFLAGPSVFGMSDPGHSTAISLFQINRSLLSHNPGNTDGIALEDYVKLQSTLHILKGWVKDVGDAFGEAHERLTRTTEVNSTPEKVK